MLSNYSSFVLFENKRENLVKLILCFFFFTVKIKYFTVIKVEIFAVFRCIVSKHKIFSIKKSTDRHDNVEIK